MTINRLNQGTTNQVLVKAISGQTTNLLELQDSSGNVVSSIGPTGALGGTIGNSGLVHINTTSWSAVATANIDNVFSAAYKNYRLIFNITSGTTATGAGIRLRVGGVTNNSNNYYWIIRGMSSNSATPSQTNVGSNGLVNFGKIPIRVENATINSSAFVDIYNPFASAYTSWQGMGSQPNSSTSQMFHQSSNAVTSVTTSYDGFEVLIESGNFTGSVSVFGYKD